MIKDDQTSNDAREGRLPRRPSSPQDPGQGGTWPSRSYPTHGVRRPSVAPVIVFVTVCTKARTPWLASNQVHDLLVETWRKATSWRVSSYVLMPDHLHLFAAPGDPELPLDNWVRYWKSAVSRELRNPSLKWQKDYWDRRLRSNDNFREKVAYMRENPVRKGLVEHAQEWPYQGEIFELQW
jgi:REP-associated tyrosine transposase